jgi:very-short-patch-repair endonuclease
MAATNKLDRAELDRLLGRQYGVITRSQAADCGLTDKALRHRVRPGGPWQTMVRGVYLAQTGVPSVDQRDMAAVLYAGPGSVITGTAALRQFGLPVAAPAVVDVLVPSARWRDGTGLVRLVRTTRMPAQPCFRGEIRFAMVARAVADAARGTTSLREVRALVAGAVQKGWCGLEDLRQELRTGPATGSALLRRVLAEVGGGIRSVAEGDFSDLITRAGLPEPMFNARLFVGRVLLAVVDAWWPAAGVAAEVDSREWHMSPEDWERSLARHARLTSHGILALHFTPRQIRTQPDQVAAAIRAAMQARPQPAQREIRAVPASA